MDTFKPQIIQGRFGAWNVHELAETGVLTKGVKFSVDADVMDTKAHLSPVALDQIVRSRTTIRALLIDFDGEAIADANGNLTGLANVYAGQNLAVCAHFAADILNDDGSVNIAGRVVMGFKRDPSKYLQIQEPGIDLSPTDAAAIKWKGRYLPWIDSDAAAA